MYRAYLQGVHDAHLDLSQLRDGYQPGVGSNGVGSLDFHEKWSLVTFVNDGNLLYLYKDGKLITSEKTGTGPDDPFNDTVAATIFIGGPVDLGLFNGKMDDLRIYNYALNNDEIKALYNIGGYSNKIVLYIDNPMMTVDDKQQEIDPGKGTSPIVVNGWTMVPIRAIIEAMGGTVKWTASEERIDIALKSKQLQLWVGKTAANLNGEQLKLDVPPLVSNGRTMVPLRFVSENLGCKVEWDKTTKKITLLYSK